jgi:15-cis-phytoene synthase / lycopene beta-cyclase
MSSSHIIALPLFNTLLPITAPTIYLWMVDTFALQRGTWVINEATKTGLFLWPHLEIEEAIFFLVTNTLVVFGQVATDHALAILTAFPERFPNVPAIPDPLLLLKALFLPREKYDARRLKGMQDAVGRLRSKSRSFWLASAAFEGRLRLDLLLLWVSFPACVTIC